MITGIGVLQPGDGARVLSDKQIDLTDFVVLRERWKHLNPSKTKYDFARLNSQIERCARRRKPFVLGVMTGADCAPDWIPGKRLNWSHQGRKYANVLAPWEASLVDPYDRLMQKLWSVVSPAAVWITGPTIASQEMHTNGVDKQKGWSPAKVEQNWKDCFDCVRAQFNTTMKLLSITGQAGAKSYLWNVIDYCQSLSDPTTLAFQHNSLGPQTTLSAAHHAALLKLHRNGWPVGYELVESGASGSAKMFPEASYGVWYPKDIEKRRV